MKYHEKSTVAFSAVPDVVLRQPCLASYDSFWGNGYAAVGGERRRGKGKREPAWQGFLLYHQPVLPTASGDNACRRPTLLSLTHFFLFPFFFVIIIFLSFSLLLLFPQLTMGDWLLGNWRASHRLADPSRFFIPRPNRQRGCGTGERFDWLV